MMYVEDYNTGVPLVLEYWSTQLQITTTGTLLATTIVVVVE